MYCAGDVMHLCYVLCLYYFKLPCFFHTKCKNAYSFQGILLKAYTPYKAATLLSTSEWKITILIFILADILSHAWDFLLKLDRRIQLYNSEN